MEDGGGEEEDCEEWEVREDGSFCRVYHPALDEPALKQVAVSLERLGLTIDSNAPSPLPAGSSAAARADARMGTVDMEQPDSSCAHAAYATLGKNTGTDRQPQPPPKRPKTKS